MLHDFAACWLLFSAILLHTSSGAQETLPLEGICCFNQSGVSSYDVGGGRNLMVVDGFFCPKFLELALKVAFVAHKAGGFVKPVSNANYPGERFYWTGTFVRNVEAFMQFATWVDVKDKEGLEHLRVLFTGEWIRCVGHAGTMTGFDFSETYHVATQELAESVAQDFVNENGQEPIIGMFSRTTGPQSRSAIHVDEDDIVVNVHLSPGLEDTATAFYRTTEGQDLCHERGSPELLCNGSIHEQAMFVTSNAELLTHRASCRDKASSCSTAAEGGSCYLKPKEMFENCRAACGVCRGFWPGPNIPSGRDYSGLFQMHKIVPFTMNRVTVYSGNLPHGTWFSEESISRVMVDDVLRSRLVLGIFLHTKAKLPSYPLLVASAHSLQGNEL